MAAAINASARSARQRSSTINKLEDGTYHYLSSPSKHQRRVIVPHSLRSKSLWLLIILVGFFFLLLWMMMMMMMMIAKPVMQQPTKDTTSMQIITADNTVVITEGDAFIAKENITVTAREGDSKQQHKTSPLPKSIPIIKIKENTTASEKGHSSIVLNDTMNTGKKDTNQPKAIRSINISEKRGSSSSSITTKEHIKVTKEDILRPGWNWDSSPIVIESHKLIFFTIPKVGCTVFKRLFRRMMGHDKWRTKDPHDMHTNGLNYLHRYSFENATAMLTSPEWTNAIFVREPKERFLSAYLDKGKVREGRYVVRHCCPKEKDCVPKTMLDFLEVTRRCYDPHWAPQIKRMNNWNLIDFVGSFSNARDDTEKLLKQIGAWEEFGSTGWGVNGTEAIFGTTKTRHATGSETLYGEFFTSKDIEHKVKERYAADYGREEIANAVRLNATTKAHKARD